MQQFQRYFIADSKQLLILIYFSHEMINLFFSPEPAVSSQYVDIRHYYLL